MEERKKKKVERVIVHVRVRPFNDEDRAYTRDAIVDTIESEKGLLILKRDAEKKTFVFDTVFSMATRQQQIYERVGLPVVRSVLEGYNGTILAYGQTGTGKTHTMIGSSGEQKGVIPRAIAQIFEAAAASTTHTYQVQVGFVQLYMEMLQDLLRPDSSKPIKIRESPEEGVYLTGIQWITARNVRECIDLMHVGDRNRSTAFTRMNSTSSRSHAIYMVRVERRVKYSIEQLEELEKRGEVPDQSMTKAILYLVDLAGSERVKKSRAAGSRLDEAKTINLALLALGNVIQALSDKKHKFVPFRDSKLTRLLEDSLGGNSKTSLVITIGPSVAHWQESCSSLFFGSRAMKVENRPEINKKVDYRALCAQLQAELDKINDGDNGWYLEKQQLLEEIEALKAQLAQVTSEKEQLENMLAEQKGSTKPSADLKKIQEHYRAKFRKQEEEHKKFIDEVDHLMLEQEERLNNMRSETAELKATAKYYQQEMEKYKAELDKERTDREEYASMLSVEHERLKEKLANEKDKVYKKQQLVTELTETNKTQEEKLQDLTDELNFIKAQHQEEISALSKEVQKQKGLAGKAQTQHNEAVAALQQQLQETQQELADKENTHKLRCKQYEEDMATLETHLKTRTKEKETLTSEKSLLIDKLDVLSRKATAVFKEKKKISQSSQQELKEVWEANQFLELKVSEMQSQQEHLTQTNVTLETELEEARQSLTAAHNENLQGQDSLHALEKQLSHTHFELETVSKQLEETKAENQELNTQYETTLKELEDSSAQNKEIMTKLHTVETALAQQRNQYKVAVSNLMSMKSENEQVTATSNAMSQTVKTLQEELTQLQEQQHTLTEQLRSKESFLEQYKQTLKAKGEELGNLQSELQDNRWELVLWFKTYLKEHKQPQGGQTLDFLSSLIPLYQTGLKSFESLDLQHLTRVAYEKFWQQRSRPAPKEPLQLQEILHTVETEEAAPQDENDLTGVELVRLKEAMGQDTGLGQVKSLCYHLTSLLTITAAMHSDLLWKQYCLGRTHTEQQLEEKSAALKTAVCGYKQLSQQLEGELAARKSVEKEKKVLALELERVKQRQEQSQRVFEQRSHAAVVIQRFYRGRKQKEMKKKAFIAEYVSAS